MEAYLRPLVSCPSLYDNQQADQDVSSGWLSYKDDMKPVVADNYPCF